MLDQRVDGVFVTALRLVGEAMALEIQGDDPESGGGERGHVVSKSVHGATPTVYQQNRRRRGLSALHHPNSLPRIEPRKTHAICRIAGGKHFARTKNAAPTKPDHQIRSIQFLCPGAYP